VSGDEGNVEIDTAVTRAYFFWSASALVDGQTKPITSSASKQGSDYTVTLVYPHGTKIVHDPILGVGSIVAAGLLGSTLLYIALGAAILAAGLVFAVRRLRPRIQNSVR
jgi:hypothetical protein